jgi:hypothetical protein
VRQTDVIIRVNKTNFFNHNACTISLEYHHLNIISQ